MIDRGLLVTMLLAAAAVALVDRRLRRRGAPLEPMLSLTSTPLLVGLAVARLVAVALDDPATMLRPFDLLLIRGGMEFWGGVLGAATAMWVGARRSRTSPLERVADVAPFALLAYAVYEAACLVRDGCFGPASSVGIRPGGLGQRQVPVGILVGLAAAGLSVAAWRLSRRVRPAAVFALSLGGLALIRSAAGFASPRISAGLTRPHRESLVALALSLLWTAVMLARGWATTGTSQGTHREESRRRASDSGDRLATGHEPDQPRQGNDHDTM
ncbi:MAG: prolipoprotein diacylglyceryl transferase family protein [Acidimicrobiales bacterium]